ncbi:MAG: phosphatase PAP2-related protein [Chitinophagaceae bacterium]
MAANFTSNISARWSNSWNNAEFKKKLIIGLFLLAILLATFPLFFDAIERRDGHQINDWLLNKLPAVNLSYPIFGIIWFCAILTITQAIKNPNFFLLFMWGFILLSLSRIVSITVVAFNPPQNLVPLKDPLTDIFYGGKLITKDLFYSGHTSTMFLMYLCLEKNWHKTITLLASILIGTMVLFQHVHYAIDVVAAPFFTYWVYWFAKKIVK